MSRPLQIPVASTNVTTVSAAIVTGVGDGTWDGATGIVSRTVASATASRAVGWMILDDGSERIAFAAPGDTNVDGAVDILDAANFVTAGIYDLGLTATWNSGDFNYDGASDILDAADFIGSGLFDSGSYLPAGSAAALDATSLAFAALASADSSATNPRKKPLGSL